ncbi:MAG: inactive serine/threonine-protein kinase VRK3 [Candidatus Ozemobacteraceae bacterium]
MRCPECDGEINDGAKICKFCAEFLDESKQAVDNRPRKKCPTCGQKILEEAKKCRVCREFISESSLEVGTTLGDFTITDTLGEGSFAKVFKAKYSFMDRFVAIKVLNKEYCEKREILDRFLGEARIGFDMSHPRILKVFNISPPDRKPPYFVMEFLEGKTLREMLIGDPLPIERTLTVISGVLEGLIYAHEFQKKVIHRDLKPDPEQLPLSLLPGKATINPKKV